MVYDLNKTIYTGTADWNIDLVMGAPPHGAIPAPTHGIARTPPSTIQIGIEIKSTMTEHRKAIRNRKRDFEAHHDHLHRYNNRAIAGAVMLLNGSGGFLSPLRKALTIHRGPEALVKYCVDQMRAVTVRSDLAGSGLEAKAVLVVDFSNQMPAKAKYITSGAVPKVGDPMHYDAFIQAVCSHFTQRFAS